MAKILSSVAFTLGVLAVPVHSVRSQDRITPSIACNESATNSANGLNFQFRSAVLTMINGGRPVPTLRITLAIRNLADVPIGVLVYGPETSASLDTGLTLEPRVSSGMSLCSSNRDYCGKNGTTTTIAAKGTTNALITLQSNESVDDSVKQQLAQARSVDFAAIVYAVVGSEAGYLPISCVEMPLRNMLAPSR